MWFFKLLTYEVFFVQFYASVLDRLYGNLILLQFAYHE